MNKEEFVQKIQDSLPDYLPENRLGEIKVKCVTKNNGVVLTGISVTYVGGNLFPVIYLEPFFEQYKNGREFSNVMQEIAAIFKKHGDVLDENAVDCSCLTDWNFVKSCVLPRLINVEKNEVFLKTHPHKLWNDLAIVYAFEVGETSEGKGHVVLTDRHMLNLGVGIDELHDAAMANLEKEEPELVSVVQIILSQFPPELREMIRAGIEESSAPLWVLSNKQHFHGAAMVLSQKALDIVCSEFGEDFIIIPSSIHEVMILPCGASEMTLEDILAMVKEVNGSTVSAGEVLSDNVYIHKQGVIREAINEMAA